MPESVTDAFASCERITTVEQLESVLVIANDIASLRGEPLSLDIVERLLEPPKAPTKVYPKKVSAVISAIEDGLAGELRRAVTRRSANLEEISDYHDGMTPLLLALYQRDLKMTEILVAAGADVNHRGHYSEAPIHLAMLGRGTKRLEILLAAGADPSLADDSGGTARQIAEKSGAESIAEQLRSL